MKKRIGMILIATLFFTTSCLAAEIDLSSLSFTELLELNKQVNMAIMESDGWQEVTVPIGIYKVGEEIPAGTWTVKKDGHGSPYFRAGKRFEDGEVSGLIYYGGIESEEKVILEDGNYVQIMNHPIVFCPYVASFSFSMETSNSEDELPEANPIEQSDTVDDSVDNGTITEEGTVGERNALKSALQYLEYSAFSYSGLIEQLEYEGFTTSEATYAVDHCGADWNEQAYQSALQYLEYSSFSKQGLIEQLEYEGFTTEQAQYGVEKAYQ